MTSPQVSCVRTYMQNCITTQMRNRVRMQRKHDDVRTYIPKVAFLDALSAEDVRMQFRTSVCKVHMMKAGGKRHAGGEARERKRITYVDSASLL